MSESIGNLVLKQKYNLHAAPEVAAAAKRTMFRTGERVPHDPNAQIENYLDRFKEILDRPDPEKRESGINALKKILYDKFVIKPQEIPEAYWENQKRLLRERGQGGDLEYANWQAVKDQNSESILADQRSSLDSWIDYLASPDASYPDWLKYWTMRNISDMSKYDKEKKIFPKRSKGTTNPFPELNREALAYVLDIVKKKHGNELNNLNDFEGQEKEEFDQLLHAENFTKLYAWAIDKVTPASAEQLALTEGKWIKYDQNSDHRPLVESLQGHGTGWCTAGESTAQTQLAGGDFYVYYSNDQDGNATVPRVAIRMDGANIAEVRGIAHEQNLDPQIGTVVQDKLKEFPDGALYEKKVSDMKLLTIIENKAKEKQELSPSELIFLYEVNELIEGFGYQKDPRIEKLRNTRDTEKDMPIVFNCAPEQIARSRGEINQNTKAFVGELTPGIFNKLPMQVEYVYTSFPEKKIQIDNIFIGGETSKQLQEKLKNANIEPSKEALHLLNSDEFTTLPTPEQISLVKLTPLDLGLQVNPTTEQLFQRASEFGLELCPAEVGPSYRLLHPNQRRNRNDRVFIGMNPMLNSQRDLEVFELTRYGTGTHLETYWAAPRAGWNVESQIVFCRPKVNN